MAFKVVFRALALNFKLFSLAELTKLHVASTVLFIQLAWNLSPFSLVKLRKDHLASKVLLRALMLSFRLF